MVPFLRHYHEYLFSTLEFVTHFQQLLKYKKPKEVGVLLSAQSNKESRDKKKVKTTTTVDLADKKKCDLPGDPR